MKLSITETGIYILSPTGTIVYSNTFTIPLNIPSGYVENCIIRLFPVLATSSELLNQNPKLPSIIATEVIIKQPVNENHVNNKNFFTVNPEMKNIVYPYRISPIAEDETSAVITPNNTFFGCTKKASSLPVFIVSDSLYALLKSRCEKP